ncbi:MAG: alpha/beta hydrolase [Saprospiraceae bacterium]|nr:alpha/beta hydrolase [Saprospiraceae bacterium]
MTRGSLFHEAFSLPKYWWKVSKVDTENLQVERTSFGPHRRQYYLTVSPQTVKKESLVIYLHGGGWCLGKPEQFIQNALLFTQRGYKVVIPSYRRVPYYNLLSIREDLIQFLKTLKTQKMKQGLPGLLFSGISAGGHLASLMALDRSIPSSGGWSEGSVKGLLTWAAPLDFGSLPNTLPLRWLKRGTNESDQRMFNPLFHLEKNHSFPIAGAFGTADGLIPNKTNENFWLLAQKTKKRERHLELPNTHLELATWSLSDSSYWGHANDLLDFIEDSQ